MAKFLITYKVEKVEHQTVEVEEEDVMAALDKSRKRAKELTASQPDNEIKTIWNVISVNEIDGE